MSKAHLLIVALLLPAAASAGDKTITATCAAGSCSGTAFSSVTETDGALVGDMRSFRITVCAESGQTLSGGGSIEIGYRVPALGVYAENKGLKLFMSVSGARCESFPDFIVGPERGRVYPRASSVTVSGGTTLTIYVEAGTK